MIKYILCWFPMVLLAILNGAARDLGYKKYVSELTAHQISTFTLIIILGIYSSLVVKFLPPGSEKQAFFIGIVWAVLTLLFEFGFGLLRGNTWQQLLHAYDLTKGQIWVLIPVWVAIAPYLIYNLLHK